MVETARARAKKLGVPFDLTFTDISIPKRCPALGIPLVRGVGKASDNSPSLDRIVPALGYTRANVIVISNRANRIKNDATPQELRDIAEFCLTLADPFGSKLKPRNRKRNP